jgi:hypothetical protein
MIAPSSLQPSRSCEPVLDGLGSLYIQFLVVLRSEITINFSTKLEAIIFVPFRLESARI